MPRLDYTHDLNGIAGQVNSATEPRQNFTDAQTRSAALDWENVVPHSLGAGHIRVDAAARLKDGATVYVYGPEAYVAPAQVPITGATVTVTTEVGCGVFVIGGTQTDKEVPGTNQTLRVMVDGVTAWFVEIGESPKDYGAGRIIYAFIATAGSHTIRLDFSGGANTNLVNSFLSVRAVMR